MLAVLFLLFASCGGIKDSDLQSSIETVLKSNTDFSGMLVSVKDGVATLSGECKSETLKAKCEELVKGVKGVKNVINNCTITPPPPPAPPVEIAAEDPLSKSVTDAIKDFPSVKAEVKDGVITLTGEISKANLPKLMQTLNTLKPKKIDNKLTIK
jgi:osmotically-inducible protein OsmY